MHVRRLCGAFLTLILAAACGGGGGGDTTPTGTVNPTQTIAIASGNGQTGLVGATLATPLAVKITTSGGAPQTGVTVDFKVTSGNATVSPSSAVTNSQGIAQTQVTLGNSPGNVEITATVSGTSLSTSFTVSASTASTNQACQSGAATTPNIGDVRPALSGSGICLGSGEYTLVAFNASTTPSDRTTVEVTGTGVTPLTTPSIAPAFDARATTNQLGAPWKPDLEFEHRLRTLARRVLTPKTAASRSAVRSGARLSVIPANAKEGDIVKLNAKSTDACDTFDLRDARVVAITSKAIVVADVNNPAGGFTDAEYRSFGVTFDTLVDPLDVAAFGAPSDIDKNGHVILFFTRAVNELTPRGAPGGVVGGFFFERDLFAPSKATFGDCPTSNFAEMFYLLVPDPNATVNGNAHTKNAVLFGSIGTIAHEYQHLINASRRMYVKNIDPFEEVWLNEGLSHIAEELLFYRVAQFAPRQNINFSVITQTSQQVLDAFNDYAIDNFGRLGSYLPSTATNSPYANNDELATRGATWSLLRYLADHRGTSDGDTFFQLVNSTTTGHANLRNVFGASYMNLVRDWATTTYTDDLTATSNTAFQHSSWNFRSIFPRLSNTGGRYPLTTTPLTAGSAMSLLLSGGGTAYLRFSVAAGTQASVDWRGSGGIAASPLVQWTLVRTR